MRRGTGKELVASAVHEHSARQKAAFVTLNCAAIPMTLLESELFGHEKGAFTGAHTRRTGRFELAHQGTLFLDEIAEMPIDAQPRLLRLLQERQYERLGSSQTLNANVRLMAATNRDLARMCKERAFREDLYYRLNVFPIFLPPLRDRREDIPAAGAALRKSIATRMNKDVRVISDATMATLLAYDWPGNVRELQNTLERAVILAENGELEVSLSSSAAAPSEIPVSESLADVQRAHIIAVLRRTNGVIAGPNGAAARLGMRRSTLIFRLKKLGIPCGTAAAGMTTAWARAAKASRPRANCSGRSREWPDVFQKVESPRRQIGKGAFAAF